LIISDWLPLGTRTWDARPCRASPQIFGSYHIRVIPIEESRDTNAGSPLAHDEDAEDLAIYGARTAELSANPPLDRRLGQAAEALEVPAACVSCA
jgi:hypothetical protein